MVVARLLNLILLSLFMVSERRSREDVCFFMFHWNHLIFKKLFFGEFPAWLAETEFGNKMETWKRALQRVEEDGDKGGFEEL